MIEQCVLHTLIHESIYRQAQDYYHMTKRRTVFLGWIITFSVIESYLCDHGDTQIQ